MPNVALLIITDGRRDYFSQTLSSAQEKLQYNFSSKLVINDAADYGYNTFLWSLCYDFHIISHEHRMGLAAGIATAWRALPPTTDYIFHLEEDFIFNQHVNIDRMIEILKDNPHLQQLALKRGSVNPAEAAVGGFMGQRPNDYINREGYVEQGHLFTLNPCIYSYALTRLGWPEHGGEAEFTRKIHELDSTARFGFLGRIEDPPLVTHIGSHRSEDWVL